MSTDETVTGTLVRKGGVRMIYVDREVSGH